MKLPDNLKRFSLFSLCILFPLYSFGQLQIGLKGGYIYYWFTDPKESEYSTSYDYTHNAYSVAITLRQRRTSLPNMGVEIDYTNRSFKVISGWGSMSEGQDYDYNYEIGNLYV